MELRNCLESDIEGCAQVLCQAYALPPYNEAWLQDHAEAYLSKFYSFDPSLCFVAVSNSQIVGAIFAYAYPWQGEENCYIQEIFVSPSVQRESIGKTLIEKLSTSKKGNSTWLVANENAKAVQFYKSLGFTNTGSYKIYHGSV